MTPIDPSQVLTDTLAQLETGKREVEATRETNARLNRRCQKLESVIAQKAEVSFLAHGEYNRGYLYALASAPELRRWKYLAQKHGERNRRLRQTVQSMLEVLAEIIGGRQVSNEFRRRLQEVAMKATQQHNIPPWPMS